MNVSYYETGKPVIEVACLPDLVYSGKARLLSDPATLVVACTSFPERYAALASDRFLLLNFDDITNPDRLYSFKPGHAREIARFMERAFGAPANVERIIAACDGGVSRSAAVAAALMLRFGQEDEVAIWGNPAYGPNRLVFGVLCEGLGLKMPKAAIDARVERSERTLRSRINR